MNNMNRHNTKLAAALAAGILSLAAAAAARAQEPGAGATFSLKRAVALALQNSREVALARLQQTLAEQAAEVNRSDFRPNLYGGSGLGYTNGIPQTPGGVAPSLFNVAYVQTLLNPPLRGQLRAAQERARGQRFEVERVRDAVIVRTASAYLGLAKVRHSLELLRKERESAQKIVDVTRERSGAGLELPIEVTRTQLASARIEQRIVQLEGQEEALEGELRHLMAIPSNERVEVAAEELPAVPEQAASELVELAMSKNPELMLAEAERRAREQRLHGERGGYIPTLDLVGQYSLLSRINRYDEFFKRFQRHNLNVGIQVRFPLFSARTSAAVAFAQTDLNAAELELKTKRSSLEIEVRRQARRTRELDAAREVARLELQLAQESLRVLQAQFQEGRTSLRDLEKARLEESDRWLAFLEADYGRQKAQLEVLRSTGQLARLLQ